jgi:hypothetical protein
MSGRMSGRMGGNVLHSVRTHGRLVGEVLLDLAQDLCDFAEIGAVLWLIFRAQKRELQ